MVTPNTDKKLRSTHRLSVNRFFFQLQPDQNLPTQVEIIHMDFIQIDFIQIDFIQIDFIQIGVLELDSD